MDFFAIELLRIIHSCEERDRPELIPKPGLVRTDPKFSEALDYLLDCGYVRVIWVTNSQGQNPGGKHGACILNADADLLTITESGIRQLLKHYEQCEHRELTAHHP
jgi:hypothetical protein